MDFTRFLSHAVKEEREKSTTLSTISKVNIRMDFARLFRYVVKKDKDENEVKTKTKTNVHNYIIVMNRLNIK